VPPARPVHSVRSERDWRTGPTRSTHHLMLSHQSTAPLKFHSVPDELQATILSSIVRIPNFCLSSIAILRDTNGWLEFIPASDKMPDIAFGCGLGASERVFQGLSEAQVSISRTLQRSTTAGQQFPSSSSNRPSKTAMKVDCIDLSSAGHL